MLAASWWWGKLGVLAPLVEGGSIPQGGDSGEGGRPANGPAWPLINIINAVPPYCSARAAWHVAPWPDHKARLRRHAATVTPGAPGTHSFWPCPRQPSLHACAPRRSSRTRGAPRRPESAAARPDGAPPRTWRIGNCGWWGLQLARHSGAPSMLQTDSEINFKLRITIYFGTFK